MYNLDFDINNLYKDRLECGPIECILYITNWLEGPRYPWEGGKNYHVAEVNPDKFIWKHLIYRLVISNIFNARGYL